MKRFFGWALALCCVGTGTLVHAQTGWQWLDGSGRKVFSDLPPPSSVPDRNILLRPSADAPASPALAPPLEPAPKPGSPPALMPEDAAMIKALEAIKKRDDQIRRDNCRNARSRLATLNSGLILYTVNERGEPVVMDEAMRAAEIRRMQSAEQEHCRPLPPSVPANPPGAVQ